MHIECRQVGETDWRALAETDIVTHTSEASTANATVSLDGLVPGGSYEFRAWAIDQAGNTESQAASIQVVVALSAGAGDMNCDGVISYADINPFVAALGSQSAYEAGYPNYRWMNADINGDGTVNFADINCFVAILSGS